MNAKRCITFAIVLSAVGLFTIIRFQSPATMAKSDHPMSAVQDDFDQAAALAKLREEIKGKEQEPAETVFKNIQIFKGMPAGRVLGIMQGGFSRSLGVTCTHCHTPDNWAAEDKTKKQVARDMWTMMGKINSEMLSGIKNLKSEKPAINCTTCHRGQAIPALNLPAPSPSPFVSPTPSTEKIIQQGKPPVIDGKAERAEWLDTKSLIIEVEKGWHVFVRYKQDEQYLYFNFSNLKIAEKKEFYPEVLIDTKNARPAAWGKGQWWFHSSYSNCEGDGIFNNYKSCKKGAKSGWNANNFPIGIGGDIEMSISKAHIGVKTGDKIGLAFDVTDTSKKWLFYPAGAKLDSPATWEAFTL